MTLTAREQAGLEDPNLSSAGSVGSNAAAGSEAVDTLYSAAVADSERYEVLKDIIDECIDLSLNYRQSGHPGGSRSKVHILLALLLSGAMRWDIRKPWLRFADRFVLGAGHTTPAVYATLAVLNEGLRARSLQSEDPDYVLPNGGAGAVTWESLLGLRRRGGLPGHAEMADRSLFFKYNTGPSGHGLAPAAGEALALKLAGAADVKVFILEGEGGLTPGASHEMKNTAWGLGLSNLIVLVDWNDFGIDPHRTSSVVPGSPAEWFKPYGWRVTGTDGGSLWEPVLRTIIEVSHGANPGLVPSAAWFKTRKGRGYGKYDYESHGVPWPANSEEFWVNRRAFMSRYDVAYEGVDRPAPTDTGELGAQAEYNLNVAMGVLRESKDLVEWLSGRLVSTAKSVPSESGSYRLAGSESKPTSDRKLWNFEAYPARMWKKAGEKAANRAGLGAWAAYINASTNQGYGRPLFIACSADLAESTNIAGFGQDFSELSGCGWYDRTDNQLGAVLPTEITEFSNAGLMAGLCSVNLASNPFEEFAGFWGACSTYGAFSYLKYGPMRLFSQLAQDCDLRVGRLLWIAGHTGVETAEDSRTHFGIFAPGVTQLFPEGQVIDLHPWEYNEVPVVLAAAFATEVPIIALHLTRPAIVTPDRDALGMPSHFAAAKGAYVLRSCVEDVPKAGTVYVRGTLPTHNLLSVLKDLDRLGLNVKVVAAVSPQLFRAQSHEYQRSVMGPSDRYDAMVITNGAFQLMHHWADGPLVREYSLSADWDDRWRTGGSLDEIVAEAQLTSVDILAAITRFVGERPQRLARMREMLEPEG